VLAGGNVRNAFLRDISFQLCIGCFCLPRKGEWRAEALRYAVQAEMGLESDGMEQEAEAGREKREAVRNLVQGLETEELLAK
jgi:hypothetical protein